MSPEILHPLADPVGDLPPPTPYYSIHDTADPLYALYGPGEHTYNLGLELDPTGEWLLQSTVAPEGQVYLPAYDAYSPIYHGELHLYHRVGEQWHHTWSQTDVTRGGWPYALRWSPDSAYVVVWRQGQAAVINPDGSQDPADAADSRRLQVFKRVGDSLVLHSLGPADAVPDAYYYGSAYGFALEFDPTGTVLATGGLGGFNGLLHFDQGVLTVASGFTLNEGFYYEFGYDAYVAQSAKQAVNLCWNPADPTLMLRIGQSLQPQIWQRVGDDLVYVRDLPTGPGLYPSWHRSGTIIALVQAGVCGQLQRTLYSYPGGDLLGSLHLNTDEAVAGDAKRNFFDRSGQYATGPVTSTYQDQNPVLNPFFVARFDPAGHLDEAPTPAEFTGFTRLPAVPDAYAAGGPVASWGCDPGGGGRYLAVPCEDVILGAGFGNEKVIPDTWASRWGFRTFRIDGDGAGCPGGSTPQVISVLAQRQPDGSQPTVGGSTDTRPFAVRLPDLSMRTWPGEQQAPLYQKQPDGTWRMIIGKDAR